MILVPVKETSDFGDQTRSIHWLYGVSLWLTPCDEVLVFNYLLTENILLFTLLSHAAIFFYNSLPLYNILSSSRLISTIQFCSVAQLCLTLCDPMDCHMPDLPVHHELLELTQTHVHWVSDGIQPSHPLLSPSPPTFNHSQHQGLFRWVSSSHQVAKVLEFQLQHQSLPMNIQDWFPLGWTGWIFL